MFTNGDIIKTAMRQSALDMNCREEDFLKEENVVVRWEIGTQARAYYKEPIACNLVSYGNNVVASVKDAYREIVREYLDKFEFYHCFETPNMHWLEGRMNAYGQQICFMAEYFLPNTERLKRLPCDYKIRVLTQEDFADLYLAQWGNALCEKRKELDILGVGAYEKDQLIGLAGCSADCADMWQIGIDVLPAYRGKGIAASLTSNLAVEVLERGKVPFYCCAWSNIRSAKNAIKSGFSPAWVELTVKPKEVVEEMNR